MTHYTYLIVGGGMAAKAAVGELRKHDPDGSIGLITADTDLPYDRPPLSKALWTGRKQLEQIFLDVPVEVEIFRGRRVKQLDPAAKSVVDNEGDNYTYDKLLLATGSKPSRLPFGEGDIIYFRTARDYRRLRELSGTQQRIAVIGGGFIGSEIAAALAMQGNPVTLVFPEDGLGAKQFPADLSLFLNDYYREKGVEVLAGQSVSGVSGSGTDLEVRLEGGGSITAAGIVAGIGVKPNVELAEAAGLTVDDGVHVDAHLQTSAPDVYAAGDIANFEDPALGARRRVEHEDAAVSMGKAAARNMAGAAEKYEHSPMFYSDLFDLGYEAVGELDSRLEMVADWQEPFKKGVVFYLRDDRVRGVLLWNVWDKVDAATALIAKGEAVDRSKLKASLL